MAGRKRVYAMPVSKSNRPFKKRRISRRKRRGSRKSVNFTSQSGRGTGLGFSRKRTSLRKFKRLLWDSSTAQTHYRSNFAFTTAINTTAVASTMSVTVIASRRFNNQNFWTTAGGAINPDGGTIPTFVTNGDFTIRGGMYGLRLCNAPDAADTDKDAIQCIVYLVKSTKNWNSTNLPASVPVGFDPSLVQDFQTNIGKIVYKKEFLLEDTNVAVIEKRMGLSKIDISEYQNSQSEFVWIILTGIVSGTTIKGVTVVPYYNLSFVGDTV
ncbi:putative capsid protein [Giant house spider associated circular virus 2]|uniref:Putative capsid protein n=1 Tax=Giant house spider associated circular virus 2 TaxID=2293289 RepID=A0A346BPD7_9VIRU|nr:putative capsid protein [Giant house spider associated circular virus 2]AXL65934.1 putative capsid protein [Giant house spider associated circular virus 2]